MPTRETQYFSVTTGTFLKFFAILIGLAAVYFVRDIIIALFFAVIVASAIDPAVVWLERKIPRILAAILVYLVIGFLFLLVVYLIVPIFFEEIKSLNLTYVVIKEQILSGLERFTALPLLSFLAQGVGGGFWEDPPIIYKKFRAAFLNLYLLCSAECTLLSSS